MSYASQSGRAHTDPNNPRAFAVCDRCGLWWNHYRLQWQFEWAGSAPVNRRILVCPPCLDVMQEQLRAIILPPDPVPISQPRPEPFIYDSSDLYVSGVGSTTDSTTGIPVPSDGDIIVTQDNDPIVPQQTGEPPGGRNQTPGVPPGTPADNVGKPYDMDDIPRTGPL